ncbi:TROVE domain-containing protein [Streptosporangium sp. NPDC023825]|uniref:TROVE domain-containing protein n=1 Tax=Streptosporangium sp. NPDC023825 TaxID=3154909 RepID=UPI00343926DD
MPKLNSRTTQTSGHARLITTTTTRPNTRTGNGAPAYTRDAKGELFLLATTTFHGENNAYESGDDRSRRLVELVREIAVTDFVWLSQFARWLRAEGNIRTVSIVIAAEAVKARLDAGHHDYACSNPSKCYECKGWTENVTSRMTVRHNWIHYTNRKLVDSVLQRADEPGELIAYWLSTYGKPIPISIKRGISDAIKRLWTEYSFLKYDSDKASVRFGDVVDLVQPAYHHKEFRGTWQYDLMGYALAKRHNRDEIAIGPNLPMIRARVNLMGKPVAERRRILLNEGTEALKAAGMTWESVAGWLQGPMDAAAWEAIIPSMGYMSLIRNLRNFDEARISRQVARQIAEKLGDPEQVARSRQLPYRFLSAHLHTDSLQWASALDAAMDASVRNIPSLPGRTLVMVDTSGSMDVPMSAKSKINRVQAGAMFGVALAAKGEQVDLYGWADRAFHHPIKKGASVLRETARFCKRVGEAGHGTLLSASLNQAYKGHDRIVVVSDMQTTDILTRGDYAGYSFFRQTAQPFNLPAHVNLYGFNLAGHKATPLDGKRGMYEMGGLTDQTFANIARIEASQREQWPWEMNEAA